MTSKFGKRVLIFFFFFNHLLANKNSDEQLCVTATVGGSGDTSFNSVLRLFSSSHWCAFSICHSPLSKETFYILQYVTTRVTTSVAANSMWKQMGCKQRISAFNRFTVSRSARRVLALTQACR